jgi:hypothetical protein
MCFLPHRKLKWTEAYLHKLTSLLWISYDSSVLSDIMTKSSCAYSMQQKPKMHVFCMFVCSQILGFFLSTYLYPALGADEVSQWGVIAASHCWSWWRRWSDASLLMLTRLWLQLFLSSLFWFWLELTQQLPFMCLLWSFLCNLVDVSTSCQYQGCILFNVNSLTHKVMERLCPIQRLSFLDWKWIWVCVKDVGARFQY